MARLRVGVIGVGEMSRICHLPIIADLPQVELAAFCDTNPENLVARGNEYGVERRYSDHHELFGEEDLDAVCVFVPPFAHTDAELIAAERGIGLFVEKPPALSMGQAHEISSAITDAGIVNAVGFNERYRKVADAARTLLEGKAPVQGLIHRVHGSRAKAYWWMREELSGGAFVENTIHKVDLLRYLAGDLTSVSCRIVDRPDRTEELNIPLSHCATYTLAGGGVATVTTCTALERGSHSQFLVIAGGSLFDLSEEELRLDGEEVARDDPERAAYRSEFETFFDAVAAKDQSRIRAPYCDAVKTLGCVLGAVASARNGGAPVDLTVGPYA
jgi:predicted dehydrogenase